MPTVQVPLQSWDEITELKRNKNFKLLAAEKVALKQQADRIKLRLDGDEKTDDQGLSAELYLLMDKLLPAGVSSVEFEGYQLSKVEGGESSKFDKQKLMQLPIPCSSCAECRKKKVVVFVTVRDIEACTSKGSRKPTVSAEKIKPKKEK